MSITINFLFRSSKDDKSSIKNSGSNCINPYIDHSHHPRVAFKEEKVPSHRYFL